MKKTWITALLSALVLCVVLLAACDAGTPKTEATITFNVEGQKTTIQVPFGKAVEYPGQTTWEDDDCIYSITGWDKPLDGVFEDTAFTATVEKQYKESYTIRWQLQNVILSTETPKGQIPTPPDFPHVLEDASGTYTFSNWDKTLAPATADAMYRAVYNKVVKEYDITFKVDGKVVQTKKVKYGTLPEPPSVTLPEGCVAVSWGLENVSGDATYDALFVHVDSKISEMAVKAATTGSIGERGTGALFLGMQEKQYPGTYTDEIVSFLRWIVTGGNEPDFDFTPNMRNPMTSGAVAVAKATPSVWNKLSSTDIEKLDLLMSCFAVQAALATDDSCKYTTGPGWNGNYNKTWNPNYPLSNVTQIIFATSYFGGAEAMNKVLKDFDYDTYIAKFKEWGWTNVLGIWGEDYDPLNQTISYTIATEPKFPENKNAVGVGKILTDDGQGHYTLEITTSTEDIAAQDYGSLSTGFKAGEKRVINYTSPRAMMMTGGTVYTLKALYRVSQYCGKSGGSGIGVPAIGEKGYCYKSNYLTDLEGLWNSLLTYNYSGGECTSKAVYKDGEYLCFIADGSTTPTEGLVGMMKEFNSGDRSSVSYCSHDFTMCQATTSAMVALGLYDPYSSKNLALTEKVWVGNTDYLYKAKVGYASYTGTAVRGNPTISRGSGTHYEIWKYDWLENGAKHFTLEDFQKPKVTENLFEKTTLKYAKDTGGSADLTQTLGSKSKAAAGTRNYWENDLFLSFSFNYMPETLASFEIRLRSGDNRSNVVGYNNGKLTPANQLGSVAPVTFTGYGWHRITLQLHQGAVANETGKSVDYSITLTIYVDGVKSGEYQLDPAVFQAKGWLLYNATYDETKPGHLIFAPPSGDPYVQIFKSGAFNNSSKLWFVLVADDVTACTTSAPVTAPVTYVLNDGHFENDVTLECADGFQKSYASNNVPFFTTATQIIPLVDPVREGYVFDGWYSDAGFTGDKVTSVTTEDGTPITLYAKWIPQT